jgi:hypothetical protein
MQAPEGIAAGVNGFVRMLKVVMLAAVSSVVGLLLLLCIYRQQQVQQKRRALRYAGGCMGRMVGRAVTVVFQHSKGCCAAQDVVFVATP